MPRRKKTYHSSESADAKTTTLEQGNQSGQEKDNFERISEGAENLTTVHCGMAEDREDGNTGEGADQFDVLNEVGDVENGEGEFPDDNRQDVEDEDAGKQVQSNEATASNDVKSKESSRSKDKTSGKDEKSSNQSSSGKDTKHTHKDVSSNSFGKQKVDKTSEDKKKTETKDSESQRKSTGSAVKRKSDNRGTQKPEEAKKMKLSSGKEDNKRSGKEIEVISKDSRKEHQLSKKHFVTTMINLSEELTRAKEYRQWVKERRKDGMVFPLFDIDPPAKPILFNCCELVSGYVNDSTKLCIGFARNDEVLRFSACEAQYVPGVGSAVKAFEEMVRSCSKPLFDPITQQGYWHGVTVIANSNGKTLLTVHLYAANEQEGEVRFAEAKDILVKYFSSRPELDPVSSIYLRLVFATKDSGEKVASERMAARFIMGDQFIVETISGTKVNLYPWSFFSTGVIAMTALCEQLQKVLLQEDCKTVVELGCGSGIVGQFLAKHSECVLGVDTAECIAEARVNADENHLSNCTYFDKNMDNIWTTLGDVLQGKPSAMVIVNALNYDYLDDGPVLSWLTRSSKVCRVVYVKTLETPKSRVTILCTPTRQPKDNKKHDDHMSYFPLYALPVNLGVKFFATILVLQHVESNFINELFKTRKKYTEKCIRTAYSRTSGVHMVGDDPQGKRNSDGMLTTHIDTSRRDGTLPPRNSRNVLQSRPGHKHISGLLDRLISPSEIQGLRTVSPGNRMYAERHVDIADDFREERFIDEIIHDRNRNLLDSSFVDGVVPPETEDLRQVLQELMMVENIFGDRNERSGEFYGRGQVRVHENNDLWSFIEENRATHKNEGKDFFRESSRLPRDAGIWGGARMSFRDELSSARDLYSPDIRGKLYSINEEPEAFPLVKDSALFERGLDSKINVGDERRKLMFADIQDMRNIDADLRGSGPGRSFDDTELGRRKPRTDDIASGIKTDVRGLNIRAGGWKARDDIRNMGGIHDSFSKFDAYLSNVKSSDVDLQHSWKDKPEFNQFFPKAGMKDEWRPLSPNWKLRVKGDIQRENPYHDDKPNYFVGGDKSSKAEWFAFNERRPDVDIADRNRITLRPEDNRMFVETDRNRTHIDGSERNRVVGESVNERRIFGGPERTGASVDGPDDRNRNMFVRSEDRKRQMLETVDRNKQVFSEPNRNNLTFGGSEDRERPLYDDVEDRNRSVYGELENRKRQMYDEPDDRKRQMYGETDDIKRQMLGELDDRKRQMFGELDDIKRQMLVEPDDRKRQVFVETEARLRSLYAELEDIKKLMYSEPGDLKMSAYDEPADLKRSAYDELRDRKRSAYDEPGDRKRSTYETGDRKRSVHGEPIDSKGLHYGELEDKRSVYEEPGDRKRSVYGGSEDRSGYMFSKTDDRNLLVTERSGSVVEVGWNRPTAAEIERNRLMADEREGEVLFGGRTDTNRTGYYAADSKVDNKAVDGDKEASKQHYHQQQQHAPLPLPPPPPPPLLTNEQIVEVQTTKENRKRRAALKKTQKIVPLKAREAQQSVTIPAEQARGSSVTKGKDGKTYIEETFVKNNDANNMYVADRSLEKGPQANWAMDRGREPAASHQTPSSMNREWDKVQSSGGYSSAASWASCGGQEDRQRDIQEQYCNFRTLQTADAKHLPPLSSQYVGKYGTSDEQGRSMQPSSSTFGQSSQNYGHSYQQYGLLGSAPAQTSTVGTGDMSQYGSWQGGGSGGRNTSSGQSTTGGWGRPGAWNTSNNWSSQSGNGGYTWG